MTRKEVLNLMCDIARQPHGSITADAELQTVPGWDSLAGVEFEMHVLSRWDVELDTMRVTEAVKVAEILALFGARLEN